MTNPPDRLPPRGDFKITTLINSSSEPGRGCGDIVSQYDAATQHGFALQLLTHNGGPTAQANRRNLSMHIGGGEPRWSSAGRPDGCRMAFAFAIHNGQLIAGINDPDGPGRLVAHEPPNGWRDLGVAPDGSNAVQTLTVHNGELFVATGCYDGKGSALPAASNVTPGGNVYRVDDDDRWHDCGNPYEMPTPNQCPALFSFGERLYLASSFHPDVFVHEGGQQWTRVKTPPLSMCVLSGYRGQLFGAPKQLKAKLFPDAIHPPDRTPVYVLDGETWRPCGPMEGGGRVYTMCVHDDQLFAGSWPQGRTHRSATGEGDWIDAGDCGRGPLPGHDVDPGEIMAMAHYHGALYVGTLPFGEVYRYDGDHHWTRVATLDDTPDVVMRRVWTCAEYDGGLYFSTLPSGEVFRMDVGAGVTAATSLPGGKHEIIAERRGDTIALHVDGACVAQRSDAAIETMSIGDAPLQVGRGRYAAFDGAIESVHIE